MASAAQPLQPKGLLYMRAIHDGRNGLCGPAAAAGQWFYCPVDVKVSMASAAQPLQLLLLSPLCVNMGLNGLCGPAAAAPHVDACRSR